MTDKGYKGGFSNTFVQLENPNGADTDISNAKVNSERPKKKFFDCSLYDCHSPIKYIW